MTSAGHQAPFPLRPSSFNSAGASSRAMITVPAEVDYCGIFRSTNNPNGGVPRGPVAQVAGDSVGSSQAHFAAWTFAIARAARRQFEFTLAAIAQNLRRLAKLVARPPPLVALCVT
jgi:hypothetical protein